MIITDKQIRKYLGHNKGNRRVKITRTGDVHYYGSTDAFNRNHDYWHFAGYKDDIVSEMMQK